MKRGIRFVIAVFLLWGAVISTTSAVTYYVDDVNGLDSRTPTQAQSINTPWKTIGKAASTMGAGDTTYIRGGTYNVTSSITPTNSGSAGGGYITFSAYQNEVPIINGGGGAFRAFAMNSVHSYFRWVGLTMQTFNGGGGIGIIRTIGPLGAYPHHMEILNCIFKNCSGASCIKAHGVHDIIFAGSVFQNSKQGIELAVVDRENDYNIQIIDCKFNGMSWDGVVAKYQETPLPGDPNDPLYWCEDVYLTSCESYNCTDDGFDLFGRYYTIEHCIAHNISSTSDGHGFKVYAVDVPLDAGRYDADFYRCLVYSSAHDGYKLSSLRYEESDDYVKKYRMLNCTSANNVNSISLVTNNIHPMDVIIKNSIISGTSYAWEITAGSWGTWSIGGVGIMTLPSYLTLDGDYNLWYAAGANPINYLGTTYNLAGWQSFSGQDGNSISVNPTFDANYHPGNSACIDSGVDVGLPYAGNAPDMGFYESGTVEVNCPATYLTTGENWISIPIAAINDGPYSVFKDLGKWPNRVYHNLYRYNSADERPYRVSDLSVRHRTVWENCSWVGVQADAERECIGAACTRG